MRAIHKENGVQSPLLSQFAYDVGVEPILIQKGSGAVSRRKLMIISLVLYSAVAVVIIVSAILHL